MAYFGEAPWLKINDFMMEVLALRNIDQFGPKVLEALNRLVPHEAAVSGWLQKDGFARFNYLTGDGNPDKNHKMLRDFNEYYCYIVPGFSRGMPEVGAVNLVDCNDIRDTEYYNDFQRLFGIRHTANLLHLGDSDNLPGIISLARQRCSLKFTDRERAILEIIQPHLSNLYCFLKSLSQFDYQNAVDQIMFRFPVLTRREAEIAAMISRKFSTSMIGSVLLIKPHSVHKHVENIFGKLKVRSRKELIAKLLLR